VALLTCWIMAASASSFSGANQRRRVAGVLNGDAVALDALVA
jgi:hypothetical protein